VDFTDYDTRLAAYAVIVDEYDRILLTWYIGGEHSPACWSMPGGGVEFDESLQQAVAREVLEETGYTVEVGGPIAVHHFTKPNTGRDGRPYKSVRVRSRGDGRIAGHHRGGRHDGLCAVGAARPGAIAVPACPTSSMSHSLNEGRMASSEPGCWASGPVETSGSDLD
jgi:8-oxo-dGTP pyrophosphatase MutT (NUDIX family)